MFGWRKKRTPMPEPELQAALRRQALKLGVPEQRYDELVTQARDQLVAEGGGTWYDILRRAALLAREPDEV